MIIDITPDRATAGEEFGPRRRLVRHPVILTLGLCYLAFLVAYWLTLATYGDRWWFATFLMLSPRWPFAFPLLVLAAMICARRAWGHALWCAAALPILALPILGMRTNLPIGRPPVDPATPALRLMSFNVHREQVDPGELLALIAREKPDVIAFQDWTSANEPVFSMLEGGSAGEELAGWRCVREGELAVASRHPIGRVVPVEFPDAPGTPKAERGAAAGFEVQLPSGPLWLVNVHLASPHTGLEQLLEDRGATLAANSDRRWGQSEQTLGFVETLGGPVIVAGDFNTTDDSPMFRAHWGGLADAFSELGFGIGYTYVARKTQIRIDHILGNAEVRFVDFRISPRIGSPHHPLIVEVGILRSEVAAEVRTTSPESANSGEADPVGGR